jgi:phosphatidylglycerophosphatase A
LKNSYKFRNSYHSALTLVATIGILGHFPFAPGTIGSLFALVIFFLTDLPVYAHLLIIVIGAVLGIHASTIAEKILKEKDSKKIIIDEFIGFYVSVFYLPKTFGFVIAAFLLFRFFDILKPLFISKLEKTLSNGLGVMADDILAGIYTNMILQIWLVISKA